MCLISGFKRSITAGDVNVPVRTDFRVWLSVDKVLKSDMATTEKIVQILGLVYTKLPEKISDALNGAMDFYGGRKKQGGKSLERLFDFEYDGELILAAFWQQYGINLLKESMHWHEFLALLSNLSEDTLFIRTVRIRGADLSKIKDKDRRRELLILKKACALPHTKMEEKENAELILSLKKEGDR